MNTTLAWREILARVFDSLPAEEGVTPDWLVNPSTGRRLKLDYYYPDARVAIRFVGDMGRRKAPISEQEIAEEKARERAREKLCDSQGVCLVTIDVVQSEPPAVLREISAALSRAIRRAAQGDRPRSQAASLIRRLEQARSASDSLSRKVRRSEDLVLYADLWRDRLYAAPAGVERHGKAGAPAPAFAVGSQVEHDRFGLGRVVAVESEGADAFVRVRFDDGTERRFVARLLAGRMRMVKTLGVRAAPK